MRWGRRRKNIHVRRLVVRVPCTLAAVPTPTRLRDSRRQVPQHDEARDGDPARVRVDLVVLQLREHVIHFVVPVQYQERRARQHALNFDPRGLRFLVDPLEERVVPRVRVRAYHSINPNVPV